MSSTYQPRATPPGGQGASVLKARLIKFGYSTNEDRLTLEVTGAGDNRINLCLTRRFTAMWINGIAGILERSSPTARKVPAEVRDDLILMEHQSALQASAASTSQETSSRASRPAQALPLRLVSAIKSKTTPPGFEITLESGGQAVAAISASRVQLHRLLEELNRIARAANWNVTVDAAWMDPNQAEVVFN